MIVCMTHACSRCNFWDRKTDANVGVCTFDKSGLFNLITNVDEVCGLSYEDELKWEEAHPERVFCSDCSYWAPEEGVCCNANSGYCADFWEEGCEHYEL